MRVMKAGIPTLRRGRFEGAHEIGLGHPAHNETLVAHEGPAPHLSFAAATSPSVT
jgi:hypothetical protein